MVSYPCCGLPKCLGGKWAIIKFSPYIFFYLTYFPLPSSVLQIHISNSERSTPPCLHSLPIFISRTPPPSSINVLSPSGRAGVARSKKNVPRGWWRLCWQPIPLYVYSFEKLKSYLRPEEKLSSARGWGRAVLIFFTACLLGSFPPWKTPKFSFYPSGEQTACSN